VKRRTTRALLALTAVLALLAAACGDDDDTGAEDTSATTTEETTADASTETTGGDSGAADTVDELCTEAKDAGVTAPEGFRVNLVTDLGHIDDGTFNQQSYETMIAAAECFGFEDNTSYIETSSEADYAPNIATSLESNPDVIITSGSLITNATLEAAQANPDVKFIGVDQFNSQYPDNLVGILFREDQGGFLAGTMAGLLTESGVVGVVGGREDVPPVVRFVNSFEKGAKSVDPDIRVLHTYNESFTDPNKGASDARQFIGEGADVVFGAGGPTGSGGIKAAAEDGAWAIGVDLDEYFIAFNGGDAPGSDRLATSAIKRVDLGVFRQIVAVLDGSFEGGAITYDASSESITYAPFHDADIPDDVATQLEETRQGLADGSIDTGVDPITGLPK
jgi:basic membrane lipoprotein Med (substrate-binding protein (PBP1-ABC) superfamily)